MLNRLCRSEKTCIRTITSLKPHAFSCIHDPYMPARLKSEFALHIITHTHTQTHTPHTDRLTALLLLPSPQTHRTRGRSSQHGANHYRYTTSLSACARASQRLPGLLPSLSVGTFPCTCSHLQRLFPDGFHAFLPSVPGRPGGTSDASVALLLSSRGLGLGSSRVLTSVSPF